jgi:hypothetical protein
MQRFRLLRFYVVGVVAVVVFAVWGVSMRRTAADAGRDLLQTGAGQPTTSSSTRSQQAAGTTVFPEFGNNRPYPVV